MRAHLLGVLLLAACDPEVEIAGKVLAADGGIPPSTKVELACTGGAQLSLPKSVQTDSLGHFVLRGTGCLPPSCVLFSGTGLRRTEENLMEWCRKSAPRCGPGTCTNASVTLVLP